jgi:sortase A
MTATLPDRDTETVTPPASSPASSPVPTPARPAKAPEPRLPRPGDDLWTVVSTAGTMVAIVCLWVVGQMLFLSSFAENRSQELLYREFRVAIAGDPNIVPPIGPTTPVGDPVALLSIPRIGVSQVVVEGTASGDTLAGPGHLRNTVLPGQAGTSVVFGRAATYGAPFRDLDKLHRGDTIDVVMAQGEVKDFKVVNIRRAGDPYSQPLPAGGARLILATAEGSGPLAALSPGSVLYVDADAPRGFIPPSGLPATVPDPEQIMHSDHGAFPLLALHLALLLAATLGVVVARQRWSAPLVWIVAAPVAVALAWSATDVVMRLLPNVV